MSLVRLILVRHGQTEWNVQGRLQGHLDSPLTALGCLQASAVGSCLESLGCDALVHSDLGRTCETARLIAAETGLPLQPQPALRERALGIMEGLTKTEVRARYPQAFRRYEAREPDFIVPRGESLRQVFERTRACLEQLALAYDGATLAVVTHGGILDAAYRLITGTALDTPRRFPLFNAGLNRIDRYDRTWRLESWGDIAHLQALEHKTRVSAFRD
ncbi:MAG TPA: histidine phosphatase family protein [Gammaproteobacteria bacterium]|nr:histidine phosphatase family protein [Gammaproteobacteria bacterium]